MKPNEATQVQRLIDQLLWLAHGWRPGTHSEVLHFTLGQVETLLNELRPLEAQTRAIAAVRKAKAEHESARLRADRLCGESKEACHAQALALDARKAAEAFLRQLVEEG